MWRRMPLLGKVFVGLAVLDIVVHATRFAGLSLNIEPVVPMSLVTAFLPRSLLILLPAVILARRPDAARATPLILRGAVIVALVELVVEPLNTLVIGPGGQDSFAAWGLMSIAASITTAIGFVAIAIGLAALNRSMPGPAVTGLANLVAGTIGLGAITSLLVLVVTPQVDLGLEGVNAILVLASAFYLVPSVALAVLARAIVRGTNDARRPAAATFTATAAMVISAVGWFLVLLVNVIVVAQVAFLLSTATLAGSVSLGWAGDGMVMSALVIAFGLGLADGAFSIPAGEPALPPASDEAPVEAVAWPVRQPDLASPADPAR